MPGCRPPRRLPVPAAGLLEQRCSIDLYALAKATDLQSLLAAVQGTPWAKVLAPLANAKPDRGLTAQAEPLMQEYRHRALVAGT